MTVPANYLEEGSVKSVGIVLAHGNNAELQRGPFLTALSVHLAKQGYVVMRYLCRQKEQRRQRIFERSVDTATASPYARSIRKWVYIGHENGARIAAQIGYKIGAHRPRNGFIFLSYPLLEPAPPPPKQKAGADPPADSKAPLMKLIDAMKAPELYICGEMDYNCPGADLQALGPRIEEAGVDARAVILSDLDSHFKRPDEEEVGEDTIETLLKLIDMFLEAVEGDAVGKTDFPKFDEIVPSTRVPPRPAPPVVVVVEEAPPPVVVVEEAPPPPPQRESEKQPEQRAEDVTMAEAEVVPTAAAMIAPDLQQIDFFQQQQQQFMAAAAAGMAVDPVSQSFQQMQTYQLALVMQQQMAAAAAGAVGGGVLPLPLSLPLPYPFQQQPPFPPLPPPPQ